MPNNKFDDATIDEKSFAYRDILGLDKWSAFIVTASLTVVGTPTYTGRYRIVGAQCFFQISAVATTSIASTAGTHYFALPIASKGLAGIATMTDATAKIAVGVCHVDVATARVFIPSQAASANIFLITGWFEIG